MKQAVSWTSNCKLQFHARVSTPDRLAFEHSQPDTHMDSVLRPSQPQPSQPPSELSSTAMNFLARTSPSVCKSRRSARQNMTPPKTV